MFTDMEVFEQKCQEIEEEEFGLEHQGEIQIQEFLHWVDDVATEAEWPDYGGFASRQDLHTAIATSCQLFTLEPPSGKFGNVMFMIVYEDGAEGMHSVYVTCLDTITQDQKDGIVSNLNCSSIETISDTLCKLVW